MKSAPDKILILRLSSIGDILLTTPLVRALRSRFPDAEIDYALKEPFIDLLRTNPNLNRLHTLDPAGGWRALWRLRRDIGEAGYDLVVDVHKNIRTLFLRTAAKPAQIAKHSKSRLQRHLLVNFGINLYRRSVPMTERYLASVSHLGVFDDGAGLELILDPEADRRVAGILTGRGWRPGRFTAALVPGAGRQTKQWPADRYAEVARILAGTRDAQILILGDGRDVESACTVTRAAPESSFPVAGEFGLMESACALSRADLVICNDSGAMHMARALNLNTVAIFGPTTRELGFYPAGARVKVVEHKGLDCRPCSHIGPKKCPKKHFRCMLELEPEQVLAAADELLNKSAVNHGKENRERR